MSEIECVNCGKELTEESVWRIKLGTKHRDFCSKDCAMELIEKDIVKQTKIIKYLVDKLGYLRKWKE
jgi:hypothetical protein